YGFNSEFVEILSLFFTQLDISGLKKLANNNKNIDKNINIKNLLNFTDRSPYHFHIIHVN
ncbi:hypothetical protein ACS1Z0_003605, partial [Acinetobacter baumannii]